MKKKIIILLSVVIILLIGIVVWFNIPLDLMDLDPNEVMEIVVFNGNSGNATHITDKEQIQHIVENLNGVEVKRSKPSLEYTGYSFTLVGRYNTRETIRESSPAPNLVFSKA